MKAVDQYLQNAVVARAEAEKATTETARACWAQIARSWLTLSALEPPSDGLFDKEAKERGTGQDVSTTPQ